MERKRLIALSFKITVDEYQELANAAARENLSVYACMNLLARAFMKGGIDITQLEEDLLLKRLRRGKPKIMTRLKRKDETHVR